MDLWKNKLTVQAVAVHNFYPEHFTNRPNDGIYKVQNAVIQLSGVSRAYNIKMSHSFHVLCLGRDESKLDLRPAIKPQRPRRDHPQFDDQETTTNLPKLKRVQVRTTRLWPLAPFGLLQLSSHLHRVLARVHFWQLPDLFSWGIHCQSSYWGVYWVNGVRDWASDRYHAAEQFP